jgi:hypothetical protein
MFRLFTALALLAIASLPAAAQSEPDPGVRSGHADSAVTNPFKQEPAEPTNDGKAFSFVTFSRWRLSHAKVAVPTTTRDAIASQTTTPPPEESQAELAKKLNNPVASLISVPLQNNLDCGVGETGTCRNTLNLQPVIPLSFNDKYNLIIRTILPVIGQGSITEGGPGKFGLGDITQSFFFSPKQPVGGLIVAVGPVGLYPTGTSRFFGPNKWGAGPTALVLKQSGPWTVGMLANHIWSFAGPKSRGDVNSTFLQPFLSHTSTTAWTVSFNTESSYDWENRGWAVPLNLNVSKVTKLGHQLVSIGAGPKVYVARPNPNTPKWGIRFVFTLLYPKKG